MTDKKEPKDTIFKHPVVEFKVYPGKEGREVKDVRIIIDQSDSPDDFVATETFIESLSNTAKNDANEKLTREERKKANNELRKHHSEKIYFKPFHRKTEKRLKKMLESFGIEEYNHYKDIIAQRNEIKDQKANLDKLKETHEKEAKEHEERLGHISIPAENKTAIFNPTDYAMLSEFPKPSDYKALNFSTEAKRNVDYANKRFAKGIGISPQVNRVQFKNEYFHKFIDREFLLKNKYIHDNAEKYKAAFKKSSHKFGSNLNTIVEEDEEDEEDEERGGGKKRFAGGSYRPVSYETFILDNFKENIDHVKQISDYETETKKDDTRISAPLETGVMVYVQLKGPDTMEATISKYIGYAVKDATENTKCAAPINTAKLYGKENKCENFYTVTYYSNELSEKIYSDSNSKPIAVPQSRIKIINDSLVARLNDEINIPFTNVNYFNFLHMVKYALTKISIFGSKWSIGYILSELKEGMEEDEFKELLKFQYPDIGKLINGFLSDLYEQLPKNFAKNTMNALQMKRYVKEQENYEKKINDNTKTFEGGVTRKRKHYFKKTIKNKGGGEISKFRGYVRQGYLYTTFLYSLLTKFIDTSNIYENPKLEEAFSKDPDDEIFKHQRVPLYIVVEQFRFLLMAYAVCENETFGNFIKKKHHDKLINTCFDFIETHDGKNVTLLETTIDILRIDDDIHKKPNKLIYINGKIHELITVISNHPSFNSKKDEIGKLFEEAAKQMFTHYTDKIFKDRTAPIFIAAIIPIIRKWYPLRVLIYKQHNGNSNISSDVKNPDDSNGYSKNNHLSAPPPINIQTKINNLKRRQLTTSYEQPPINIQTRINNLKRRQLTNSYEQ